MTYRETLEQISTQLQYSPQVENSAALKPHTHILLLGMGGSRLVGDILKLWKPELHITIHSDFELPDIPSDILAKTLIIANSASGNTQETLSGLQTAIKQGYSIAVVAGGGSMLALAKEHQLPYVEAQYQNMPARLMLVINLLAVCALVGDGANDIRSIVPSTDISAKAEQIAKHFQNKLPVMYASQRNISLAYIWKVILNETAKLPAFCNRLPELAHNELETIGHDSTNQFAFLTLHDAGDDMRIQARMDQVEKLLQEKNRAVESVTFDTNRIQYIIESILCAHWTALKLAESRNIDPLATPLIEQFKLAVK